MSSPGSTPPDVEDVVCHQRRLLRARLLLPRGSAPGPHSLAASLSLCSSMSSTHFLPAVVACSCSVPSRRPSTPSLARHRSLRAIDTVRHRRSLRAVIAARSVPTDDTRFVPGCRHRLGALRASPLLAPCQPSPMLAPPPWGAAPAVAVCSLGAHNRKGADGGARGWPLAPHLPPLLAPNA
jgi:hypothetical protein